MSTDRNSSHGASTANGPVRDASGRTTRTGRVKRSAEPSFDVAKTQTLEPGRLTKKPAHQQGLLWDEHEDAAPGVNSAAAADESKDDSSFSQSLPAVDLFFAV